VEWVVRVLFYFGCLGLCFYVWLGSVWVVGDVVVVVVVFVFFEELCEFGCECVI